MERLKKIGQVKTYSSDQIKYSRVGLGFEKLDRDVFDPEKAYDKVAALGVKWIRIQSGWARTETKAGVYEFEWLDSIVDNLLKRGLQPWICLCYGNSIYTSDAAKVFGAVGHAPVSTAEEQQAWNRYVTALVKRYTGKVSYFEVWNEPDGIWCWKTGPSGKEYGEFVIRTAEAIRAGNPEAKVIGGSLCCRGLKFMADTFATGAGKVMDAFTYHNYAADELMNTDHLKALKALCYMQNPNMEIIQGETGTQSRSGGSGALHDGAWSEWKQAKFLVRHFMADFAEDVKFASYFSCVDMIEALNGTTGDLASYLDYGYFGVLRAEFDENGRSTGTYSPKPQYYALQTIASVFREDFTVTDLPIEMIWCHNSPRILRTEDPATDIVRTGFRKPNGSAAVAYWVSSDLMTTDYQSTISMEAAALPGPIRLIDLIDGSIYEIPDTMISVTENSVQLNHLPLRDAPYLLTFGDFAD